MEDPVKIHENAHTIKLAHKGGQIKTLILLHGYTSTPYMFRDIASALFNQGYNVLVPRAPYHGYSKRLSKEIQNSTAKSLQLWVKDAVIEAKKMGSRVGIAGISMGGVLAAWAAMECDVEYVAILSPAFFIRGLPFHFLPIITGLLKIFPNTDLPHYELMQ